MPAYIPLWCKSNYSFLEGASHPDELVQEAFHLGLPAVTITDRNGVYGVVKAHEHARTLGLPLILGSQISVPGTNLVLLARDREGYARLCALLSLGHLEQPKGQFQVSWRQIAEHAGGLTALWQPEELEVPREQELSALTDAFGSHLYAMVSRHRWIHDARREKETLAWARRFGVAPVAATEVLYHETDRQDLHDVLTCIRHGVRLSAAGTRLKPNAEHSLKTPKDFAALYCDHPDWIHRTLEIAGECRFSLADIEYRYPVKDIPEGADTDDWLRELTFRGARERYPQGVPDTVKNQVDKELKLIKKLKFPGYFLTMKEIVDYCKNNGILCQGRGSAANSAVCFCLGITAIDPTKVNLLFERFLSEERAEAPDIDLDIGHDRREEVIAHMYEHYGRKKAAMVANVVSYRSRSALREVGKVLEIPKTDLDQSAKLLAHHDEGLLGATRDSGMDLSLEINRKLLLLAGQLYGFPRHLSIHPGGFLLGSEDLSRIVPIENATMPGRTVIQWDKTDVETMNLFKVDLLGLGALTHLDYAFGLLRKHKDTDLSMATIPKDDKGTYEMICKADTIGVFQIESRAQMSMLPRLKPVSYYDLVIQISIVRPGPISGGMVHPYLKRRQKLEPVTYPHPKLEPVLGTTLGIPLFQEQVMKLAMVAADYTPGEADQLRRDMAAWKQKGGLEGHHDRLIERMGANGIDNEYAERIFSQIKGFGEYGFPESHAASFALIAYATAWMKRHHPDVFSCALLNAWPMGFYSPMSIIGDAKRHGVAVLPADILKSDWDCTLEKRPGFPHFSLRIGLRYVKGLSRGEADRILALRGPGQPGSLALWKVRSGAATDAWEKLAVGGALQGFGVHRRKALWQVLDTGDESPLRFDPVGDPALEAPTYLQTLIWDYNALGHSTQAHVLQPFRAQLRREQYRAAIEVSTLEHPQVVRYAGVIICRQRPGTAKGVMFLTLEDETGTVNVVVWSRVWEKFRKVILTSTLLAVSGTVEIKDGVIHLIAERLWSPEGFLDPGEVTTLSHDWG